VSGAGSLLLHPISSGSQWAVGMDVRRTGVSCSELVTGSCWAVLVGRDCCDDLIGRVGVMTRPWIVDDDLWAVIEPLPPSWPEWSPGPKPVPDRLCLQGIPPQGKPVQMSPDRASDPDTSPVAAEAATD
jgi:hypothetical protein